MIEFIITVAITVSSVLMFGYWFRYTCLLILSAKTARDYSLEIATANQLGFVQVQSQLQADPANMGGLCASLDRDYAMLSSLLKQGADSSSSLERQMLAIHYRVTRAWFNASSQFSASAARRALEEMSMVVAHFANAMGEQAASAAAA